MLSSIPMIEPRRRSPLKRGAGAGRTEGRNEVEDGARRCGPRSRLAGSDRRRGSIIGTADVLWGNLGNYASTFDLE